MKHIEPFNNRFENLKDSLSELTDSKEVQFTNHKSICYITVKLESHFTHDINDKTNLYDAVDLDLLKKSTDEKWEISNLVMEGLVRSQIDYSKLVFNIQRPLHDGRWIPGRYDMVLRIYFND